MGKLSVLPRALLSGELDAAGGLRGSFFISISPAAFPVNKSRTGTDKKEKAMENFHRFTGASCLTRTGDTLLNSQVL